MIAPIAKSSTNASEDARRRLVSVPGDPFLLADWDRALFLHFRIPPQVLQLVVPGCFKLDLYEGEAIISIVAITMRNFRPSKPFDPLAYPFRCIREQRFLNLRTYVRWNNEPGALFLRGWLSQPAPFPLPSHLFGLPYDFADSRYEHGYESGTIRGNVISQNCQFCYSASPPSTGVWQSAESGSLAEFAMERYSGFFCRGEKPYVFRAWHPLWPLRPVTAAIENDDLIKRNFPWWKEAQLAGANFSPGFERVRLGKAHALPDSIRTPNGRRILSRFFEIP